METFIIYLFKVSVAQAMFYMVWHLFMRNETYYKINRIYFVFTLLLAFIIPALDFSLTEKAEINLNILLEAVEISNQKLDESVKSFFRWNLIFYYVYFIGVTIFSFRFIIRLLSVYKLILFNKSSDYQGFKIIRVGSNLSVFSFFNYIFVPHEFNFCADNQKILTHEGVHVRQLHSIDVLLIEMTIILLWFNPLIYILQKSLKENHEYLADFGVLEQGFEPTKYKLLLLEYTIGVQYGFANNFNKSLILKRLVMMDKMKSKWKAKLKLLFVLPVFMLLVLFFACSQNNVVNQADEKTELKTVDNADSIYSEVEVMPEYPGGEEALRNFIAEQVKYPETAKKEGIEGKVFVSFVINSTGKVEDVKIAKGVAPALDEEAIRVINLLSVWTPAKHKGKNVSIAFTIPIAFKLDSKSENPKK